MGKSSRGQNFLNFLFFGAPSFSNKPKLGLNLQLKVQNSDLSITITHLNIESSWLKVTHINIESSWLKVTHINIESSWLKVCRQYNIRILHNLLKFIENIRFCVKFPKLRKKTHHSAKNDYFIKLG